jgi:integrase
MRKVMDGDLSQFAGLQRARDYALVSFYLCGANLLDIYEMASSKGEVVFMRHKVQRASMRPIHIRIEPELAALLEVYGGTERLLSEAERVPNYETFQRRVNHLLKQAGKKIGVDVTLAKVRRSWATIAASLDVPDRVIDKSMGHVDASVKDRHYEQYDWSRTAEANRKIIDYIKSL